MSTYGPPQPYGYAGHEDHDSYGAYQDAYTADPYAADSYGSDPYAVDAYRSDGRAAAPRSPAPAGRSGSAGGRASAGRASVGSASVGTASPGRARVDSAAPPDTAAPRRYDWSGAGEESAPRSGSAGRASVPVSPSPGGGAGRATVRPSSGPGGPDRPAGPAGTGPDGGKPKRKKKRHWIRNILLSLLAVMVISAGGGMVALSYYVDSVPPPEDMELEQASTLYFADGEEELAVLQEVNREIIDTTVPELENARKAVIAAEDKGFMDHSGVDFLGIVRAAWNNFTGGATSGASTIDQQYAGAAAGFRSDISYGRKLEEAAMAYKMNQEMEKDEILDFYLNTIYFGRGAHGIQAAAQAYFGKDADELTLEEATVMAGCIRLPDDQSGLCPYDPLRYEDDLTGAEARFQYVLAQLVDMEELTPAERDAMELPMTIEPVGADEPRRGPQGHIVRQVERELKAMGIEDLATGGYRVTTTIDPDLQQAALDVAHRDEDGEGGGPAWDNIPENVDAALVAVDPGSGAVLAYYGGPDGVGWDSAGLNFNEATGEWQGGREPGSTMKVYTLVAALREGVSLNTHWQTSEYTPDYREDSPIRNAGRRAEDTGCEGNAPDYCTLSWSTIKSYNVPFAHFSEGLGHEGPVKIVQAAMDAGVRFIVGDDGEGNSVYLDLNEVENATELGTDYYFHEVAFGQYQITVLDHASGMATLAARGMYHEPHFVAQVEERIDGEWVPTQSNRISGVERIQTEHADAITGVLSEIPGDSIMGNPLANGRPAAAKTGTWEYDGEGGGNKDAWVVGYTPQIASAVWVGDEDGGAIKDEWGGNIGSSGLPADIWQQFMDAAHEAKGYDIEQFPPAPPVGNPQHPLANGIEPALEPEDDDNDNPLCQGPFQPPFCEDDNDDNGNGDDDNGRGDDQDNGGGLLGPPPGPGPGDDGE